MINITLPVAINIEYVQKYPVKGRALLEIPRVRIQEITAAFDGHDEEARKHSEINRRQDGTLPWTFACENHRSSALESSSAER
jgi:hypothetical protein